MKSNMPVTQIEHALNDKATLLSTTDKESHITYANSAFIDASGFNEQQLMGEPHNIIRHPDMPPAAFADMWYTLQQGDSWTVSIHRNSIDTGKMRRSSLDPTF
ncbi:PAS domain-containing protein, partial [Citrobacter freundii]|uniref:PAS domain-containing protein n=1 Tax=Citrobacter freundii TaxID=546 RepID=UPI001FFDFE4B